MKTDLAKLDHENFIVSPYEFNQKLVWLVIPKHIGTTWSKENLIFRSSVWDENGNPLSLSYKKFFNLTEKPDLYPNPESYIDWNSIEKIDGSTLCVSRVDNDLMIRTRGTIDATKMEQNGFEIEILKQKYPKAFIIPAGVTYIYEWVSPLNKIVIAYPEADLYLTNIINHEDYSYTSQKELDKIALEIGVKRPKTFQFNNLTEMVETVKAFKGMEGICLYYKNDSEMIKIKGELYLKLHRLKSELSDIEKVLDLYTQQGQPSYNDFYKYVSDTLDFEIAQEISPMISKIIDYKNEVNAIVDHMKEFIEPLKQQSRKEAAISIVSAYGQTNRSSFCFSLLDGKQLTIDQVKKLYFQVMKKG
jgi:hypothetical protein